MNRRNFLKICMTVIGGFLLAKMPGWFSVRENPAPGLKEARFYKSADRLAG